MEAVISHCWSKTREHHWLMTHNWECRSHLTILKLCQKEVTWEREWRWSENKSLGFSQNILKTESARVTNGKCPVQLFPLYYVSQVILGSLVFNIYPAWVARGGFSGAQDFWPLRDAVITGSQFPAKEKWFPKSNILSLIYVSFVCSEHLTLYGLLWMLLALRERKVW